nr:MAG TPA: hypothetical protein [Caudoviricetes sp.]
MHIAQTSFLQYLSLSHRLIVKSRVIRVKCCPH